MYKIDLYICIYIYIYMLQGIHEQMTTFFIFPLYFYQDGG